MVGAGSNMVRISVAERQQPGRGDGPSVVRQIDHGRSVFVRVTGSGHPFLLIQRDLYPGILLGSLSDKRLGVADPDLDW